MMNLATVAAVQPMENIKGMIQRMIEKLQREAAEATSTHEFCQQENKKNAENKEKSKNEMDKIQTRLDGASAKKDQLTDSIAEIQAELKEIADANAEALKVRQEQHASNEQGIKDFKEAGDAVDDAIATLKDYYASLIQVAAVHDAVQGAKHGKRGSQPRAPKLQGARSDAAGGILSILDMMSNEFADTAIKLEHQEREQKIAYERMRQDNEVSQAAKETELKSMESEIMSLTIAIGDAQGDYKMAEKQLAAVLEYIDSLKATCEHRVVPYAQRKAKREAEIEGLKEAFQILVEHGSASAFLQK
jgi:chromosome segregation ATPase